MISAVTDTHAAIWYLYKDSRLSTAALAMFSDAQQNQKKIGISVMSFIEIIFLVERQRIVISAFNDMMKALDRQNSILEEIPIGRDIARTMLKIPHASIPDMPDRIIAATALHLGVPLISRDARIRLSKVKTVW